MVALHEGAFVLVHRWYSGKRCQHGSFPAIPFAQQRKDEVVLPVTVLRAFDLMCMFS